MFGCEQVEHEDAIYNKRFHRNNFKCWVGNGHVQFRYVSLQLKP